ncbi:MAG TPA: helix-turn-helix transcriptional regulator [Coleofasciculaceae cyanobacterium]
MQIKILVDRPELPGLIRQVRELRGLTLQQLSDRLSLAGKGVSPQYLSRLERGDLRGVTQDLLVGLGEVLEYDFLSVMAIPAGVPVREGAPLQELLSIRAMELERAIDEQQKIIDSKNAVSTDLERQVEPYLVRIIELGAKNLELQKQLQQLQDQVSNLKKLAALGRVS